MTTFLLEMMQRSVLWYVINDYFLGAVIVQLTEAELLAGLFAEA